MIKLTTLQSWHEPRNLHDHLYARARVKVHARICTALNVIICMIGMRIVRVVPIFEDCVKSWKRWRSIDLLFSVFAKSIVGFFFLQPVKSTKYLYLINILARAFLPTNVARFENRRDIDDINVTMISRGSWNFNRMAKTARVCGARKWQRVRAIHSTKRKTRFSNGKLTREQYAANEKRTTGFVAVNTRIAHKRFWPRWWKQWQNICDNTTGNSSCPRYTRIYRHGISARVRFIARSMRDFMRIILTGGSPNN